jgi:hypothetical protein
MNKYSIIILLFLFSCSSCKEIFRTQWHDPGYDPDKDYVAIPRGTPKRPMNIYIRSITNLNPDSLYSINGEVTDSSTDSYLVGATFIALHTNIGGASNYLGDFKLAHLRFEDTLRFQYIGFFTKNISIRELIREGKTNW